MANRAPGLAKIVMCFDEATTTLLSDLEYRRNTKRRNAARIAFTATVMADATDLGWRAIRER